MSPRCSACGGAIVRRLWTRSPDLGRTWGSLGSSSLYQVRRQNQQAVAEGRTPDLVFEHMEAAAQHLAIAAHVVGLAEGDWDLGELQQQLQDASDDVIRTYNLAKQVSELRQLSDDQDGD